MHISLALPNSLQDPLDNVTRLIVYNDITSYATWFTGK